MNPSAALPPPAAAYAGAPLTPAEMAARARQIGAPTPSAFTTSSEAPIPVRSTVHAPRASLEEVLAIAKKIWQAVKDSKVAAEDDAGNDKLLERLQEEFKDFSCTFPLVLRWMVQLRQFDAKTLEDHLRKVATAKPSSREELAELRVDYVVALQRAMARRRGLHPTDAQLRDYRRTMVQRLVEEEEAFERIQKQVEEDMEAQRKATDQERRQQLFALLQARVRAEARAAGGAEPATEPAAGPASG